MHFRILILCCLLAFGCSKNSGGNDDREAPVVTVTEPADNSTVPGGTQIFIKANITDNNYLKEVHLEIINLNTSAEALHLHIHPGGAAYVVNQPFTVAAGISYEIRVIAEDPAGQLTSTKVRISGT